jgi:hypothetical protein
MPSAKELKDELRKLRKESTTHKPVSKMRIADVASEIERLKGKREETPAPAATPAEKAPKKMAAKITDIKVAKEKEFPTAPVEEKKKSGRVVVGGSGAVGETTVKKASKKDKLAKLLSMLESDSE